MGEKTCAEPHAALGERPVTVRNERIMLSEEEVVAAMKEWVKRQYGVHGVDAPGGWEGIRFWFRASGGDYGDDSGICECEVFVSRGIKEEAP